MDKEKRIMFQRGKIGLMVLLAFLCLPEASAQTAQKTGTGSVAGRIRIGEKGAPGVVVELTSSDARGNAPGNARGDAPGANPESSARATTDGDGRYQIGNVAAGRFRVNVLAPGYVIPGNSVSVQIGEGQAVGDVDFTLTKGGVITGRVTGNGGRPVIGEPITLTPLDANGQPARSPSPAAVSFRTDDRGIYRVYGISTGRYLVSAGRGGEFGGGPRGGFGRPGDFGGGSGGNLQRTFYPDALEAAQATVVEVEAGNEVAGIDIRMGSRETFAISGRVVDAETGEPVAAVLIGHGRTGGNERNRGNQSNQANQGNQGNRGNQVNRGNRQIVAGGNPDGMSNADGEFRIEGVSPGSYAVYVAQEREAAQTEFYGEPVAVEVSSQDVSGIEIRLKRAASIIGAVVFENANDPSVRANLQNLTVSASTRGSGSGSGLSVMNNSSSRVEPGGNFRIAGLSPGMVRLNVADRGAREPASGPTVLRIERDGADVRGGLEIASVEQVAGVRIVVAYGNSTLRGVVQVQGGTLPPQMRLTVLARRVDAGTGGGSGFPAQPSQVDASGRFQIERLVPGAYELTVQVMGMGRPGQPSSGAKQTVTVGSGTVQNVVVPLDLAALINQPGNPNNGGRPNGGRPRGGRP